jgi:hypothetical protein
MFIDKISKESQDKDNLYNRINILYPAYQIKWCCIVVNEFLPLNRKRRKFSYSFSDLEQRKAIQLKKASEILRNVKI